MDIAEGSVAPGGLELVRAFVNTRDVESDQDYLGTAGELDGWAHTQNVSTPAASSDELARLIELREALRTVLLAHHHHEVDGSVRALEIIDRAMAWGEVRPSLTARGLGWTAGNRGAAALVGLLLSTVAAAAADGTWARLKACDNDTCQWAFYDHSRSRTGRWCSMQVCGNRTKQQRFYRKNGPPLCSTSRGAR